MPIDKGLAGMSAEELAQVKQLLLPIVAASLMAPLLRGKQFYEEAAEEALHAAQVLLDAWGKRL